MPPALVYRSASGQVEEVDLVGTPLGSLADASYGLWESDLEPGDTVLLMSDGLPELLDGGLEPFGYERVRSCFAACAAGGADEIIGRLAAEAESWNGGLAPEDDITFVVFKIRRPGPVEVRG
jgi:serine phosphatase RsbU (regulator of sigma subunit)